MASAEEPTPFKQAVDGLVLDSENSSCIKGDLDESQVGGDGTSVDINNIIILIILFHGIINLTEEQIRQQMAPPTINTDALPNIVNLAYWGFAPMGLPNIGLLQELDIIKKIVEHDMTELITSSVKSSLQSSLQSIEDKANEIIDRRLTDIRRPSPGNSSGIFSRVCNFCFKFMPSSGLITGLVRSIENYEFKDVFTVCKKIIPGSILSIGKRKRQDEDDSPDTKHPRIQTSFSMSHDMCVLLFDDLRKSMQLIDRGRFTMICGDIKTVTGKAALANCGDRCRNLKILKGFDGPDKQPKPPFVNKDLAYNDIDDNIAEMGVIKLRCSIDDSGKVICKSQKFKPLKLMEKIMTAKVGNLMWSNMEACIRYCSLHDPNGRPVSNPNNTTVCAIDLSCSGFVGGNPQMVLLPQGVGSPGGGKGNKKKPKSTKKARRKSRTKRIRNKSTNIKHMRNMRNRRKCKNNTKKLKKSRRQ